MGIVTVGVCTDRDFSGRETTTALQGGGGRQPGVAPTKSRLQAFSSLYYCSYICFDTFLTISVMMD
jgi:hypothetical protein